jgi:signal transduction histidine kinase/DNA-binding response OmpR family regulator
MAKTSPSTSPYGAKILVVDDDERNAFAAVSALEDLRHEIVVARSGEEALRRLLTEEFAVILLDLHMPSMDGYETAAFIRKRRRTMRTPIVFLTAVFRDEAHLFQAYSAGAIDVVFKPIDPFILRSKVQVLVDLHLKTQEVQRQAEHRQRLLDEYARVQREKQQAELKLQRAQERQQAILKSLPMVFHSRSTEPPFRPLFVSNNVEAVTGFPANAFLEQGDLGSSRIHPDDLEVVVKEVSAARERGSYACEFRWKCANGEYRRFLDQGVLAPSSDGAPGEIWGAILDVTERRSLEEQLAQARKMEAVGQLTGGLAHDFNNLLTVIMGNIDLLEHRAATDERMARHLSAIRFAADRGRSLTSQLLAFSRRQRLTPVTLDVNSLIRNFNPLLKQAVGEAVELALDLSDDLLSADIDAAQLETALLNLAVNARDAMEKGGVVSIRTRSEADEGSGLIRIEFSDNGPGIAADALERIFEPFYTTKEVGKGSGLGLSQVYGFVKQSGGRISVDSIPGKGATFTLLLPRSDKTPVAEQTSVQPAERGTSGGARLLVVEDDVEVMEVTVAMLRELGYEVTTATDAASAAALLERGEAVDLLLSDVIMPGGQNGVDLAQRAREMRPGLKVLLSSGYVGASLLSANSTFDLINKPYDRDALADRLCALLSGRPARRASRDREGSPSSPPPPKPRRGQSRANATM